MLDALNENSEELQDVSEVLEECGKVHNTWYEDFQFAQMYHFHSGKHLCQPNLMRGQRLEAVQGGLHKKGFRRFTVEALQRLDEKRLDFCLALPPVKNSLYDWTQVWVFVK